MDRQVLAIAVDFGTTFSGVSYMLVGPNEQFSQVDNWPGASGKLYKVPTIISYCYDTAIGGWNPEFFGFAAEGAPLAQRCSMFKMFLDVNDDDKAKRQSILGKPEPFRKPTWENLGKSVDDVIGDFLQLLYNHVAMTFADEGLKSDDMDYNILFTVPAQFEVLEVEKFKMIVKKTSFGCHTVSVSLREPEAAILYTINHGIKSLMPPGKCIVLCDAGGGTVDIASYIVKEQMPRPKIEQINIVTGRPCGSMNIDLAFKRFLFEEGMDPIWRSYFQTAEGVNHLQRMCKLFSERKEAFNNEPATPYVTIQVSPPNLSGTNIIGGYLRISRAKMRAFFEDSVAGTMECLKEHVERCVGEGLVVKSIFLVGGLGSSKYLHQKVRQYASGFPEEIEVIKPKDAEFAVIRGAIESHQQSLLGGDDPITIRLCPMSYGIRVSEPWNPNKHDHRFDEDFFNPRTKVTMARNQINWLIKKGDKIHNKRIAEVKELFQRNFEKSPQLWKDRIVMCSLDNPPPRVTKDVKPACCLVSDMTGLPLAMFDKHKSTEAVSFFRRRKSFYQCTFVIVMKVGSTDLEFQLWFKGKLRSDLLKTSWGELIL
ncbi:hypothetical protein H072_3073 [Dactylellina haptotyla CBS 200.50]|uniref:Actin-like ATPase domain-containing protein n=1 Tax=Dactylellina haptotyla (strain CBS 200.50) TaxID=1284197 RepID=S8AJ80_DACHA|nr:hypothetical protein H072_3073 [Dactylellina haptotyla CBS 200.50]